MNNYDYWFDGEGNAHEISKMNTSYIYHCINTLNDALVSWRGIIPEQLDEDELRDKDKVLSKAWFVFNGIKYIDVFCDEIRKRKEHDKL